MNGVYDLNAAATSYIRVEGLDCSDCTAKLEKIVSSIAGIDSVSINFATGKMVVIHKIPLDDILKVINGAGYRTTFWNPGEKSFSTLDKDKKLKLILTGLSGILLVAGFVFNGNFETICYILSILVGGAPLFKKGLISAKNLSMDMNFLMTVAVTGAMVIGEWSEGAAVVFLFSLGSLLQSYTIDKTRSSIKSLIDIAPQEATIKRGGIEQVIPVNRINPGDIVIIKPGQKIPADGKVINGGSLVNQAPITGESSPVYKGASDKVFAGSINGQGVLEVEATRHYSDSTISRIIRMVEEAQGQKAPVQVLVDRFARYYTPFILFIILLIVAVPVLLLKQPFVPWFQKALILLVISCPCALVISTPVSIVSAIGSAARHGVLIKGGSHLEEAGKIKIVAFDKTGTLTAGKPRVIEVLAAPGSSREEVLSIAASVEKFSEHPLANAIAEKAREEGLGLLPVTGFKNFPGKGACASNNGKVYYVGNEALFSELGVDTKIWQPEIKRFRNSGNTVIIVGTGEAISGIIVTADTVRSSSRELLPALFRAGIKRVVMLTGDNYNTASVIAQSIGIKDFKAGLLPRDKLDSIKELKKEGKVAMVGDGVNDAPALALADVGIAMGGAGTDVAIETADIALMADDLSKLPYAIKLSHKTLNVIKQNIVFSLLIKAFFVVATFMGFSTLWMAVFADTGATLLVTLNGMRLMVLKDNV